MNILPTNTAAINSIPTNHQLPQTRVMANDPMMMLPDGHTLYTRLMTPADLQLLLAFRQRLTPESLYRRFHQDVSTCSEGYTLRAARMLVNVDNATTGGAVLALYADGLGEHIVGIARLARPFNDPASTEAEIAYIVSDDYHRLGIGRQLLGRLIALAHTMGIHTLTANIQADNAPALKLLRSVGLPQEAQTSHAETTVRMAIPMPLS